MRASMDAKLKVLYLVMNTNNEGSIDLYMEEDYIEKEN